MERKYTFRKYKNLIKRKGINIASSPILNNIQNIVNLMYLAYEGKVGGIYLKRSRKLTQPQLDRLKLDLLTMNTAYGKLSKVFNIDIRIVPNKVVTSKGILVRMGHGKGKIRFKYIYITRGTVIIQLTKISEVPIMSSMFENFFKKYPYLDFKWLK